MILLQKLKNPVNKLSGCCEVTKYFEKYSWFNCSFTDNILLKQSTFWDIKITKVLHNFCKAIDYAIALSF